MSIYQLSAADLNLTAEEQKKIAQLKQAWADAKAKGDKSAADTAHQQAEAIRNANGYSGGKDGSENYQLAKSGSAAGGKSAEQVQGWIDNYWTTNYNAKNGWVNGYSGAMNQRSMANYIRQQMDANSKAWHGADEAGKSYLHGENEKLAKILEENTGGVKSTYNKDTGRWETKNANLGYGVNVGQYLPGYEDVYRDYYEMTPEQMEAYRNDTDRYYNFVDQDLVRNWVDESSGFTGKYGQFVNGPYLALLNGTRASAVHPYVYQDVEGDGFMDERSFRPLRDASGNIIPEQTYLKNNSGMTDYTRQFASTVKNGVIEAGDLVKSHPGGGKSGSTGYNNGSSGSYGGGQAIGNGLDRWKTAAEQQVIQSNDYAVNRNIQALLQAQAESEAQLQNQRDQTYRDERNALDNSALYAETRGDRGGIGKAQYDAIQATALANRQAVNQAQTELTAATGREIANLRAQGEFEKADALLQIAQTYLEKLLDMEKWAAEFGLEQNKFQNSVYQWQMEFLQKAAAATK